MNPSRRAAYIMIIAAAAQAFSALSFFPAVCSARVAAGAGQSAPAAPAKLRKGVLVLPLRTEGTDAPVGLVVRNVLENLLVLHDGLEAKGVAWHDEGFIGDRTGRQLQRGQAVDAAALAGADLRYFVGGRVTKQGDAFGAALEITDRESGKKVGKTLSLDTPTLERFREEFIAMLGEVGLPVAPGQRAKMMWREELPADVLELFARGLAAPDYAPQFEEAVKRAPRSYLLLDSLGWNLADNYRPAEAVFERALAVDPAGADAARGELRFARRGADAVKPAVFRALLSEIRNPAVPPERIAELIRNYVQLKPDMSETARYRRGVGVERGIALSKGAAETRVGIVEVENQSLGLTGGTFSNWGGFASSLTDFETAARFYQRVLNDIEADAAGAAPESARGEAAVLNKLGIALTSVGRQAEAVEKFKRALGLASEMDDSANYGLTLNNLGLAYTSFGRYSEAVASFNEALRIADKNSDAASRAVILSNLGLVSAALAQYDEAVRYYQDALKIQLDYEGSPADAGVTLNNLGVAYAAKGRTDDALRQYEKALELARDREDAGGEAVALNNLAHALRKFRRYEEAAEKFQESLAVARRERLRNVEGAALDGLGVVRYEQARYAEAVRLFAEALPLRREVSNRLGEGITLHNLMLAWKARGNAPVAVFFGKQAVNVYQDLRENIQKLGKAPQESFLESKVETYRQLAGLLLSLGRLPEAELVLSMLKEEELSEFTRGDDDAPAARRVILTEDPQLEQEYGRMADQLAALGTQRAALLAEKVHADGPRLAELDAQLAENNRKRTVAIDHFNGLLDQLQAKLGPRGHVSDVKDALGMRATLRELGRGTALLYTLVGGDAYRVMLITPDYEQAYESPVGRDKLRQKVEDFRRALRDRRVDPAPLARDLYRIIVGPELGRDLERVGARTLMWSLDDVLRYLPVAALQDPEGRYLVERYSNSVFTTASRDRLKNPVDAHWTGLGAGVSKATGGFTGLPGVTRELHSIFHDGEAAAGDAGVLQGKVLLDEKFTKESLLASLQPAPRLVHIASHFKFRPDGTPDDSYLILGAGQAASGRLTLKEVTHLDLEGVNLLTLSACDTAIGVVNERGVEVESFGALAQRQGAEAVLATLWRAADGSTPLLMREFYRAREAGAGLTKAEALRQAQLALLSGRANEVAPAAERDPYPEPEPGPGVSLPAFTRDPQRPFAHPYYWAPFILIGNWK